MKFQNACRCHGNRKKTHFNNGHHCHGNHKKREQFKVLGIGWNFKMPAVAMETAKTLNLTQRWITTFLRLRNFKMATVAMETTKKREKFKVLGDWMKFQNACHCHGNRKKTQFINSHRCHGNHKKREQFKVLGIGWNFKMPAVAMETAKTLNLTQRWVTTFWDSHDRVKIWALIISCYVFTLFFIHTTSTCIVRLGDICNALRYSNQYL